MYLSSNPHFYDHIHDIIFDQNKIKITDGGGQHINFMATGDYELDKINNILKIKNLKRIDPFTNKIINSLEDKEFKFTIENGPFYLRQQVIWHIQNYTEIEYNIYNERYIFEVDPLECANESRKDNLKFLLSGGEDNQSKKVYYTQGKCKTIRELMDEKNYNFEKTEFFTFDIGYENVDSNINNVEIRNKLKELFIRFKNQDNEFLYSILYFNTKCNLVGCYLLNKIKDVKILNIYILLDDLKNPPKCKSDKFESFYINI